MNEINVGYYPFIGNRKNQRLEQAALEVIKKEQDASWLKNNRKILEKLINYIDSNAGFHNERGFALCRICKKPNGTGEYKLKLQNNIIHIPEGYFHYVEEHHVKPPDFLLKLVNDKITVKDNIFARYLKACLV